VANLLLDLNELLESGSDSINVLGLMN